MNSKKTRMKSKDYLSDAKKRARQNIKVLGNTSKFASKKIGNSVDKMKIRWEKEGSKDISKYIRESL
jgi:hypothetical protein